MSLHTEGATTHTSEECARKTRWGLWLVAIVVLPAGLFWLSSFQGTMRRVLMLTTADPNILGLVTSASMEPITVTLHTRRPATSADGVQVIPGKPTTQIVERKMTFKAPAAYFSVLDLKEGPAGPQRVGFSVWSGTFEPFQPDRLRELQARHELQKSGTDKSAVLAVENSAIRRRMRETGEYELHFEVTNIFRPLLSERQRVLRNQVERHPDRPCNRELLPDFGLERLSIPDSVRPRESCLAAPQGERNRVHYRHTNPDGTISFIVICRGGGVNRSGQPVLAARCQMRGYFRSWPLVAWVDSSRPELFTPTFEQINTFLNSVAEAPL
jgi:hypothetical protein